MALYDGFFDAVPDEKTGEYDRAYHAGSFTDYFEQIIGSGVCIHNNPDSFKVRLEGGAAVVSPGYLFIRGYWLKNDGDHTVPLSGAETWAIVARLNLGQRMIDIEALSMAQAYPDSLVLALVNGEAGTVEDTRHNTDVCGIVDSAGALSIKVEWAVNYIDNEIEGKLAAVERDIAAQEQKLDAKIAEVQAVVDSIVPPPVGSIQFSASQNVGPEWLRCDGSFVNEADYPELVAALGKLTPSGDKFRLISDGEVGPQISNGVVYGGRLWVYSYSARKLYGIDLDGANAVREIAVTSEDATFSDFIAPTTERPIALSIVPSAVGSGAKIFLCQIIKDGNVVGADTDKLSYQLIFEAGFPQNGESISMEPAVANISTNLNYTVSPGNVIPYVVSMSEGGEEAWYCAVGFDKSYGLYYLKFDAAHNATAVRGTNSSSYVVGSLETMQKAQRVCFSRKSNGEAVYCVITSNSNTGVFASVRLTSLPNGLYSREYATSSTGNVQASGLSVPLPLNVVGQSKLLFEYSKSDVPSISTTELSVWESSPTALKLPDAARTFPDAAAYLWGKDIFLIFVGTGIIFSRTLEEGDFGYLDTTSVLGAITQFGYLDYDQDEGALYLLGQDTTNTVKAAKIVLNTLYDYANDGAWLPMLASDGVPAYIKAKETDTPVSGPTVPVRVKIENPLSNTVSVLFNGEKLISGEYTRNVSENGTFSVGLKVEEKTFGGNYCNLSINGNQLIRIGTSAGDAKTESLNTQDYISSGLITLTVRISI